MINDIHDVNTVVYNQRRLQSLSKATRIDFYANAIADNNARSLFVNGNRPNVNDVPKENFEELVSYDSVNTQAYPVLVYLNGTQMVGWYDIENMYGYITKHHK